MKRTLFILFLWACALYGQGSPNCSQALTFTTATAGTAINTISGSAAGCAGWRLTWSVTGFTAATIQLEGSQDNSTWAAFSGATIVLEGSNPTSWTSSTSSNSIVVRASLPYVRVNITGVTGSGTIKTLILGYSGTSAQLDNGSGGGGGGSCGALGGDLTGTCAAATVVGVNGASVPHAASIVGTNSSGQIVAATVPALYSQSFTGQTSVVLAHGLNTTAVLVQCYDSASPPNLIDPLNVAVTDANDVTVTFSASQSGKCQVGGSAGSGTQNVQAFFGQIPVLVSPGAVGSYTWVNQGGATAAVSNGGIYMKANAVSGTHSLRMLVISAPAPPYGYVLAGGIMNPSTTSWDAFTGIVVRESSSGKLLTCQLENDNEVANGPGNFQFSSSTYWSNPTTPVADQVLDYYRISGWSTPPMLRYRDDGTNRYCDLSMDGGNNWLTYVQQARTTNLTADQIGWVADVYEGTGTAAWAAMLMSFARTI